MRQSQAKLRQATKSGGLAGKRKTRPKHWVFNALFSPVSRSLFKDAKLSPSNKAVLQMIEIANCLALGNANQVPELLQKLRGQVASQPPDFKIDWFFDGTMHFINGQENFAVYHTWLKQFFEISEAENRAELLAALQSVASQFTSQAAK